MDDIRGLLRLRWDLFLSSEPSTNSGLFFLVHPIFADNLTRALLRGYMELEDGWIALFNGYQYKVTPNAQPWEDGRATCQTWGGDLIVYGFRNVGYIS